MSHLNHNNWMHQDLSSSNMTVADRVVDGVKYTTVVLIDFEHVVKTEGVGSRVRLT